MATVLKALACVLQVTVLGLAIASCTTYWSSNEVFRPPTATEGSGWKLSLFQFDGDNFNNTIISVSFQLKEANFSLNNPTSFDFPTLGCLDEKATWAERPCSTTSNTGVSKTAAARRIFRYRYPGCDSMLSKAKDASEIAFFLVLPAMVLTLVQIVIFAILIVRPGDGRVAKASLVPGIIACASFVAGVIIYHFKFPDDTSDSFKQCTTNIEHNHEIDLELQYGPGQVQTEHKAEIGFYLAIGATAVSFIGTVIAYLAAWSANRSNPVDDILLKEGSVLAPDADTRPAAKNPPGVFTDLFKIHLHAKRFIANGLVDDEVYEGESDYILHAEKGTLPMRYALWRRSGLVVGLVASLILAIFLTAYLFAADMSTLTDTIDDRKDTVGFVEELVADLDVSIDALIPVPFPAGSAARDQYENIRRPITSLLASFKAFGFVFLDLEGAKVTLEEVKFAAKILRIVAIWISIPALFIAYRRAYHVRSSMRSLWVAWSLVFGLPYLLAVIPYRAALSEFPVLDDIINVSEALAVAGLTMQGSIKAVEATAVASGALPFPVFSLNDQVVRGIVDLGNSLVDKIRPAEPVLPGLPFAVMVATSVAPLAFSLAFGVLSGAARVKILLPSTPYLGYFVTLLPILLTALNFTLFSPLFQLTPHLIFTFAVLCLILSPLMFTILGSDIRTAYTREAAQIALKRAKNAMLGTKVLGGLLLVSWVLYQVPGAVGSALTNFLKARTIVTLILNFARGFFVTAIALSDILVWMVGNIDDYNQQMASRTKTVKIMHKEQGGIHALLGLADRPTELQSGSSYGSGSEGSYGSQSESSQSESSAEESGSESVSASESEASSS